MRVSVAKARYESQMSSAGEYFRYNAGLDRRTLPSHATLHGMILPKTHKFWEKNYPPNDWGCRCQVQVLTQYEMQSYGFKPYAGTPLNVASEDWAYSINYKKFFNYIKACGKRVTLRINIHTLIFQIYAIFYAALLYLI